MKRNAKITRRVHWYTPSGAGFALMERALIQVAAENVAARRGHANLGDATIAADMYEDITRELVRVRKQQG